MIVNTIKGTLHPWSFEEIEDTKEVFRSGKSENTMAKRKRTTGQTMIYKTLHRKLKIEQHENHEHRE